MKKFLPYIVVLLVMVAGVLVYNYAARVPPPTDSSSATPASAPWQPARLRIPALQVDAPVMNVGKTQTGVMDAPTSKALNSSYWTSVFWYKPGAAPGQAGNAVIAGHVDKVGGDPAIFWSLNTLKSGDMLSIVTQEGKVLQFSVTKVVRYPADAPSQNILNAVFGPTTEHHLNLITCSGVWTSNGYDERLVVFTTQVGA